VRCAKAAADRLRPPSAKRRGQVWPYQKRRQYTPQTVDVIHELALWYACVVHLRIGRQPAF
jgi:hypothetical protein